MLKRYIPAVLLLTVAACSSGGADKADGAASGGATQAGATAAQYQLAVACQANLDSVAKIYAVLGTQAEGAEKDKMAAIVTAREQAAAAYREKAKKIGAEIGETETAIAAAIKASDDLVKAEFEKREFEDFATWVAKQADGCAPPA